MLCTKNAEKQGVGGWDQEILQVRREGIYEEPKSGGLPPEYNIAMLVISAILATLALSLTSPQSSWSDLG